MAAKACTLMPLIVGDHMARKVLRLCESFDAKAALEWGGVNQAGSYEACNPMIFYQEKRKEIAHDKEK